MLSGIINKKFLSLSKFLSPIPVESIICRDMGLDFILCTSTKLKNKPKLEKKENNPEKNKQKKRIDPFENPSTQPLFITHLNDQYSLLFNRYYLIPKHVLVVTTNFTPQNTILTKNDLEASMKVIEALQGLAYFNHGPESGMSQPHKHIQVVPLPLTEEKRPPIEALLFDTERQYEKNQPFELDSVPYKNSCCVLSQDVWNPESLLQIYHKLLRSLDLFNVDNNNNNNKNKKICSYNWVCTKNYMMVVPRSVSELANGIGSNAMGYTGSLYVRSKEEEQYIKEFGPMRLLTELGIKKN
ncbi:ap-4-a phosphorylase ii [Anaeramoeba flamelloides]|uniref:Ap-4-a phosphorylase ii n=1 Tax=Anaeramoeba flamelloides TaxID=1746091 RepID=A0ABQ8Z281_9EUKA|nr:ap-4-a phosphorylase ii [Anaeramoeba flamelloides]